MPGTAGSAGCMGSLMQDTLRQPDARAHLNARGRATAPGPSGARMPHPVTRGTAPSSVPVLRNRSSRKMYGPMSMPCPASHASA